MTKFILMILNMMMLSILILLSIAFLTLLERKILSYIQFRKGPNKVGFKGLFQSFSDAMKLLSKEYFYFKNNMFFLYSPMMMFILSMILWFLYPWFNMYKLSNGMVFMMLILSLNVYPIILIAWSSYSNYAMLGAMRSIAQMISFEIGMFLLLMMVMMMIEDFSFYNLINFQYNIKFSLLMYPMYLIFMMNLLIEMNRTPFDLIEGESELVSGFNVEYYGSLFTMIFLAEYSNILFLSLMTSMLFFGFNYWSIMFIFTFIFHNLLFLWIRGVLPRIRYDELMKMCWEEMLFAILFYFMMIFLLKQLFLNFFM